MLGMAVVMNEIVMLGYLHQEKTFKAWWQSIIPQLFLFWRDWVISSLIIKMDGFCPHGYEVTCSDCFRILTKQFALAGKPSQRHKQGSITSKDFCLWRAANSWIKWCFVSSHTLLVGGSWQRKVWVCLAHVVPARLQFHTWNVQECGAVGCWAPLCHRVSARSLPGDRGQGQSCSGPSVLPFVGKKWGRTQQLADRRAETH